MNTQLVEALRQLNLKPGQTVTVQVEGDLLEIRKPPPDEPSAYSGQVMLLPWFDSPDPSAGTLVAQPGKLPPPDPVIVPRDDEEQP
ncbi:MAG: hypothetical protein C0501_19980 [Isosphaera sp.]|nr:hypothetical protein [Isosphaera sp.]